MEIADDIDPIIKDVHAQIWVDDHCNPAALCGTTSPKSGTQFEFVRNIKTFSNMRKQYLFHIE